MTTPETPTQSETTEELILALEGRRHVILAELKAIEEMLENYQPTKNLP